MIQFDEHIFQMGWFNHQLVMTHNLHSFCSILSFQGVFLNGLLTTLSWPCRSSQNARPGPVFREVTKDKANKYVFQHRPQIAWTIWTNGSLCFFYGTETPWFLLSGTKTSKTSWNFRCAWHHAGTLHLWHPVWVLDTDFTIRLRKTGNQLWYCCKGEKRHKFKYFYCRWWAQNDVSWFFRICCDEQNSLSG